MIRKNNEDLLEVPPSRLPPQVVRIVRPGVRGRQETRVASVVLGLALLLAIAAYVNEARETSALRAEHRRAAALVREITERPLTLVPEPGLKLMHPWGVAAAEIQVPLRGAVAPGSAEFQATAAFGKLALADSTGLRATVSPDEDPSLTDSALVLQRLGRQLLRQDERFGPFQSLHGPDGASAVRTGQPLSDASVGCLTLPGGMLTLVVYPVGPSGTLHEVAYSVTVQSGMDTALTTPPHKPATRPGSR